MSSHPIPNAALDDRLGFIGTAGSGKTYNAGGAVERLLAKKARVVIIDPLGVWWGLRLIVDGKEASPFNVAIFGGPRGDLPLNEHAGALIGETAATMAESCIIDLRELGSKSAERRFMTAFLETIYRKAGGEPFHLVVDEADLFAPQKPSSGDETLLGHMENIVRRGRIKGFIPWLISQRPAVLNKNVLSQVDGLIAFKLTATQDRDALDAWIEGQADREQGKAIKAELPAMPIGHGVVWLPAHGILKTAQFPEKITFDSSRTPKRGERAQKTKELKPLNLGSLKERLASVEAEAKANDPKALRNEIAKLKSERAALERQVTHAGKSSTADPKALDIARERGADDIKKEFKRTIVGPYARVENAWKRLQGAQQEFGEALAEIRLTTDRLLEYRAPAAPLLVQAPRAAKPFNGSAAHVAAASADGLTTPQRRVLTSLAFWKSIGHEQPTREQVAAVAGYRPGSGNFNNIIGGLGTSGQTAVPSPGRLALNVEYDGLTQGEAKEKLWSVLKSPQKRLVEAAMHASGDLSREELASNSGYSPGSGNFNNIAGSLTTMDILQRSGTGRIELSDWAREVLQ